METAAVIKDRLHDRIKEINDAGFLTAIEKILIAGMNGLKQKNDRDQILNEPDAKYIKGGANVHNLEDTRKRKTDNEILKMLKEREATYLSGEDKVYTLEEFKAKFEKEHGL